MEMVVFMVMYMVMVKVVFMVMIMVMFRVMVMVMFASVLVTDSISMMCAMVVLVYVESIVVRRSFWAINRR